MKGQTHIRGARSSSRMWAPPPSSKLNHLVRFWMLMGIHLNSRVLTIHLKKVTSSPQSALMLMVGGLIPPHFIHGCCVCCLSHYLETLPLKKMHWTHKPLKSLVGHPSHWAKFFWHRTHSVRSLLDWHRLWALTGGSRQQNDHFALNLLHSLNIF
jgi:hypothetical protein